VAASERSPVVAVFETHGQAESAIDALWHEGFRHDQIGILIPGEGVAEATTRTEGLEENAASGAATGAITGGALGAIAGAAVAGMIPGIGPVLAAGLLAGAVGGAAAGAAVGTFLGPFIALGLSEEEARHYQKQFTAGRTIVVVKPEGRDKEAITILRSHGGDVERSLRTGSASRTV
jgi:hypothetical protein